MTEFMVLSHVTTFACLLVEKLLVTWYSVKSDFSPIENDKHEDVSYLVIWLLGSSILCFSTES